MLFVIGKFEFSPDRSKIITGNKRKLFRKSKVLIKYLFFSSRHLRIIAFVCLFFQFFEKFVLEFANVILKIWPRESQVIF